MCLISNFYIHFSLISYGLLILDLIPLHFSTIWERKQAKENKVSMDEEFFLKEKENKEEERNQEPFENYIFEFKAYLSF